MGTSEHPASLQTSPQFAFGQFRVDAGTRQLWCDDRLIPLNTRVFDTLLVLVKHRDRVVEKDELMKAVWPDSFVSEDSLTQSIWALRRALGDHSSQPSFVATVPRRGYRFVAPVTTGTVEPAPGREPHPSDAAALPTEPRRPTPAPQPPAAVTGSQPLQRPRYFAWATAAVAVLAIAGMVAFNRGAAEPIATAVRTVVTAPLGTSIVSGAVVSPDNLYLAFVAQDEESGSIRLWVRMLESGEARAIPGTDGAARPFWSPTSTALGFFANGRLRTVALNGEAPRTVASVGLNPGGGSWGIGGVILFAGSRTGLQSVDETGGRVTAVTALDPGRRERAHRWPSFLPDGKQFLYTVVSNDPNRAGTYLGTLGGGVPKRLFDMPTAYATYAASGHILYVRDGALMAQRFDAESSTLRGTPVVVAGRVTAPDFLNGAYVSGSSAGLLTYGGGWTGGKLTWVDRAGTRLADIDSPTPLHNPALSEDERHVLADTSGESNPELQGVWRIDLERGSRNRLLRGGIGLWSPDGQQVAFATGEGGVSDIFLTHATGQNERKELLRTGESKGLNDWSRDGRYLVFISTNPETKSDLWLLPMAGGRSAGALPEDAVRRAAGPGVTRRAMDGLHLRRVGTLGGVRPVLPHPGHEVRDLERRRRRAPMARGRPRTVLHGAGSHLDVGVRDLQRAVAERAPGAALPRPGGRRPGALPQSLSGRGQRPAVPARLRRSRTGRRTSRWS